MTFNKGSVGDLAMTLSQVTVDRHVTAGKGFVLHRWASAGRSRPEATELSLFICDLEYSVTTIFTL